MKKTYLLLLTILTGAFIPCFSQQKKIDSLFRALPTKPDTARVWKLLDLAGYLMRTDSIKANQYTHEAIELSNRAQFGRGELRGYLTLSETAYYFSDLNRALYWANIGFDRYPKTKTTDDLYARLLYMKGLYLMTKGDNQQAMQWYQKALVFSEKRMAENKNPRYSFETPLYMSLHLLAVLHAYSATNNPKAVNKVEYRKAYQYWKRGIGICNNYAYMHTHLPTLYHNIGCYFKDTQSNLDSAHYYFDQEIKLAHELDREVDLIGAYAMKAELLYQAKQYDKAETLLLKAKPLVEKYSDPDHLISVPQLLGSIYIKKGKLAEAQVLLESAYQRTQTAENAQHQQEITNTLYELYKKQGNYPKALSYYEKNVQLRDSLFNEAKTKELNELSTKYETEKKEQSILALESEKKNQRLLIFALFGLMGAGGFIFWQRAKARNLQNLLLKQQNQIEVETRERAEVEKENKVRELVTNTMHVEQKSQILYDIKSRLIETQRFTEDESVKSELKKVIRHIDQNLSNDESWENFMTHFEAVHPDFFTKLQVIAPDLSALELKQCAYAKMNLTQKQVATLININAESVNVARFRIKKKLQLDKEESLVSFLQGF